MSSSFLTLWEQCQSAFCVLQNTPARQKQQSWNAINGNENFYGNKFPLFFSFLALFVQNPSVEGFIQTNSYLIVYEFNSSAPLFPATLSSPARTFSLLNIQEGCTLNKGCWITKEKVWIMKQSRITRYWFIDNDQRLCIKVLVYCLFSVG